MLNSAETYLCHAELAEASLCIFNPLIHLISFPSIALCNDFLLRCNVKALLFGIYIACIAIHVELAIELQVFSPYGAVRRVPKKLPRHCLSRYIGYQNDRSSCWLMFDSWGYMKSRLILNLKSMSFG